ncbi:MAG: uroporphyrinogen-III C-methyltransferase, partial [Pseudomonadota bacterium]
MATDNHDSSKSRDDEQDATFDDADTRPSSDADADATQTADESAKDDSGDSPSSDASSDDATADVEPADEPPVQETAAAPSEPPPPAPAPVAESSSGGGKGLGMLAILLALGAAGIGGIAFKTAKSANSTAATLTDSVANVEDPRIALGEVADGLRGEIEGIRDDVNGTAETLRNDVDRKLRRVDLKPVNDQLDDIANEQGVLDRRISGQKRAIDTVTAKLVDVESNLASLQGVSDTVRNTWVRAEAEYFLQTANSRLQLAGDVQSALSALRAADERIGALGDPGLIPIRAKITEEILAVEAVPLPDVEGTALALLGMAERVTELPLRADEVPQRYEASDGPDSDATGWQRAKEKVSDAFSGIVRMSPSDGSSVSVVAPEDAFFIFRNLELN